MPYSDQFTAEARADSVRAILIDPAAKVIAPGWLTPSLASLYAVTQCELVQIVGVGRDQNGEPVNLVCDDEGRLKPDQSCFRMGGYLIAGRALLLSVDDEGDEASTALTVSTVLQAVQWCAPDTDYTPPNPVIMSWDAARAAGLI